MTRSAPASRCVPWILYCAVALFGRAGAAQCDPQWQPGEPSATLSGIPVAMTVWDPDSTGPLPARLVIGGLWMSAGALANRGILAFDGAQWEALGTPPGVAATAMVAFNGQLVAAFSDGFNQGMTIASFDGVSWQTLGTLAVNSQVTALAVFGGELIAAGLFGSIGGVSANNIARWNGSVWSALGAGIQGHVRTLAVFSARLYAGGNFSAAGGSAMTHLASWNGVSWAPAGNPDGIVESLAVRSSFNLGTTYLFAGGYFGNIGGVPASRVARIDALSNTWAALGAGPTTSGFCRALFVRNVGVSSFELTATVSSGSSPSVQRWTGSAWIAMGSAADLAGDTYFRSLGHYGGQYLVSTDGSIYRFNGATWEPLAGAGLAEEALAVLDLGGEVAIGGRFRAISGVTMNGIARGNPGAWSPLGAGFDGDVYALAKAPNGDIYAAGDFTQTGGQPVNHVARWNGSTWAPLGLGTSAPVRALCMLPNGDLVVAGDFAFAGAGNANHIARWNGASWSSFGSGTDGPIHALLRLPNDDLIAAGDFAHAGPSAAAHIARWNSGAWSPLGAGLSGPVTALAALPDGSLVAGGEFPVPGSPRPARLMSWDGAAWTGLLEPISLTDLRSLCALPDGDLLVGATHSITVRGQEWVYLSRLSGTTWIPFDLRGGRVHALAFRPSGELLAAGSFTTAGDGISRSYARAIAPCAAATSIAGTGCHGSAGPLALTATAAPWLGGTFRATATGFAPGALAVEALGPAYVPIPLSLVFPVAGPGCNLLVDPWSTALLFPTNGAVVVQLAVPRLPALVGASVREQVLQFEFGAGGAWTGLSTTNGLDLSVGVF